MPGLYTSSEAAACGATESKVVAWQIQYIGSRAGRFLHEHLCPGLYTSHHGEAPHTCSLHTRGTAACCLCNGLGVTCNGANAVG